jgi:dolichyl-phosphate beta-glucosyltransferase
LRKGAAKSPTEHKTGDIEDATVTMSVVIPAYNEEERLEIMLEEAVAYLDTTYGRPESTSPNEKQSLAGSRSNSEAYLRAGKATPRPSGPSGYEILLIDDGSTDKTVEVALRFSQQRQLHDVLRIVRLEQNRGKGGAVTHGFRHVRGQYAVFADADGASKFSDLGKLVAACNENQDEQGRCVSVGSRAHLVGSDAVVQVSTPRSTRPGA